MQSEARARGAGGRGCVGRRTAAARRTLTHSSWEGVVLITQGTKVRAGTWDVACTVGVCHPRTNEEGGAQAPQASVVPGLAFGSETDSQ